jgi:carbonic anhydrase
MNNETDFDNIIHELKNNNNEFSKKNKYELIKHFEKQRPKIAIVTCSDSRVIPEFIFNKSFGDLFVVRVAGNLLIDPTVISSLEYAVENLKVKVLVIMGHTNCGAVRAAELSRKKIDNKMINEIKRSFPKNGNHIISNIQRQIEFIPRRSKKIFKKIEKGELKLLGAVYHLDSGVVDFL